MTENTSTTTVVVGAVIGGGTLFLIAAICLMSVSFKTKKRKLKTKRSMKKRIDARFDEKVRLIIKN